MYNCGSYLCVGRLNVHHANGYSNFSKKAKNVKLLPNIFVFFLAPAVHVGVAPPTCLISSSGNYLRLTIFTSVRQKQGLNFLLIET